MTVQDLFPEIGQIEDRILRERTVQCLEMAIDKGGWSYEDLDKLPFTLLIPRCPVTLVKHIRLVTQLSIHACEVFAVEYADIYTLNRDYLVAGALLHDVGKFIEYRRDGDWYAKSNNGIVLRHPFSGANLAAVCGLPDEVVHIIAVHAHEGDSGYRTPEARIVNHVDFMNFEPIRDILKK